jgi:hypothetical protein
VHGLVVKKAKLGGLQLLKEILDIKTIEMNARILGNALVMQRKNDQKVASHARAKT